MPHCIGIYERTTSKFQDSHHSPPRRYGMKRACDDALKIGQLRGDRLFELETPRERIGGFQTVAGDAEDGSLMRLDAALRNQLLGDAKRHATGCFREDAFGLREQLDGLDDLRVAYIFRPSAAFSDHRRREVAVSGIADGERARDRVRLLRIELILAVLYRIGDRRAARGLRAKEFHRLRLDEAELRQFAEGLRNFADQRAAGHRYDYVVGQLPTKLLGNLEAHGFRAFCIVGTQVDVDE